MRSVLIAAATLATSTASSAARSAAAWVKSTAEANPQVPSSTTRTASPRSSPSNRVTRLPSDRSICCPRMRSARKSACWAPRSAARCRAAAASSRRGWAVNSGSIRPSRLPGARPVVLEARPVVSSATTGNLSHAGAAGPAAGLPGGRPDAGPATRYAAQDHARARPPEVPAHMSRSTLVTGGNRGIGLAIARRLAAGGDAVTVTSRSGEGVAGLATVACDVRDPASVDDAFAKVEAEQGPVEVVVANAGITQDQLLALMGEDDFTSVIDTNLTGAYRVARRAVRPMMRMRRGRLIFISSVVGLLGSAGQANYAASKSGLVGLARSLARELSSRNITCNVVAPGFVDTDMTAVLPDERKAAILAQVPLGRLASAEEIAGVVTFLAGDDAGYITGAVIPVDGGLGMGH